MQVPKDQVTITRQRVRGYRSYYYTYAVGTPVSQADVGSFPVRLTDHHLSTGYVHMPVTDLAGGRKWAKARAEALGLQVVEAWKVAQ